MEDTENTNGNIEDFVEKPVVRVVPGDVVCERDGFMWRVVKVVPQRSIVVLTLEPVYPSITASNQVHTYVRRSAKLRVQASK